MAKQKKFLPETHPHLVEEWHPTKNTLTPKEVSKGQNIKVWWKCDKGPDHEWEATVMNRAGGNGCTVCAGTKKAESNCLAATHPHLVSEWHPTKNTLTPKEVSKGQNITVWWKCDKGPDHEWEATVMNRANGSGCIRCNESKGEKAIAEWLTSSNISYEQQYVFPDMKMEKQLFCDFFIPSLNVVIEYNGVQHYQPITHFGGDKKFRLTQVRDEAKKRYCKDNNIRLEIIRFDENIEERLKSIIQKI